jgi:asparagine synthetase B (glutamine-hydrolysing)
MNGTTTTTNDTKAQRYRLDLLDDERISEALGLDVPEMSATMSTFADDLQIIARALESDPNDEVGFLIGRMAARASLIGDVAGKLEFEGAEKIRALEKRVEELEAERAETFARVAKAAERVEDIRLSVRAVKRFRPAKRAGKRGAR